jgi:hypothetical protein
MFCAVWLTLISLVMSGGEALLWNSSAVGNVAIGVSSEAEPELALVQIFEMAE